jgi:signal transduction histidine kinase
VSVTSADGHVQIHVHDDGHGFDDNDGHDGFGLIGMRERVGLLGGRLEISSDDKTGTRIHALLPARRADDAPTPRQVSSAG